MFKRILRYVSLLWLFFLNNNAGNSAPGTAQSVPDGLNPGPDIITGDIGAAGGLAQFGSNGSQVGLGVSTTACNAGNVAVNIFALPNTNHPVIPHNLYRMSGGPGSDDRFEQIGQSWVKHTFGSSNDNECGFGCAPGTDGNHIGAGCSDTYSNAQSANQTDLGSRAWLNPFTGIFQTTANDHTGHAHTGTSHRLLVEGSDLNTTLNPGATYYVEVQYISPDEYAWCQTHPGQCNMYNNSSHRRYDVSGTTSFTFTAAGPTVRMAPAINAWTGATIAPIEPEPGVDGRAFIAWKVTGPVAGLYHYEYALYNENLDRAIQSFSVHLGCGIPLSNVGFHAPPNHPGELNDGTVGDAGFSNAPWTANQTDVVSWNSETFAQNPNANALRWGTLYNFRFDSDRAPMTTNATIGFFKTGAPVTVEIAGPNACNGATPSPIPTATPSPTPPPATPTPSPTPDPSPTPTPFPTPVLPPGGNGKIVYDRNGFIYVMDADGANQTNLMAQGGWPAWSPDGAKIAFVSFRNGSQDIYVMNANGSGQTRLTNTSQQELDPTWSPDGTKIAFQSFQDNNHDIYVMNANGSNRTRLTNDPATDSEPAWSPDGGKIAFVSDRGVGDKEIYVMDASGANQTNLTNHEAEDTDPDWSPDGAKIVFIRSLRIFAMSAYGTNQIQLTTLPGDGTPAWSPDGTKIVFFKIVNETNNEIFVMGANGSNPINLTNHPSSDASPDWQRIAPTQPPAAQALNLSTRMRVQTGNNVGIGGFIITGSTPKHVLLRAIGPSLAQFGILDALADPAMELHGPGAFVTLTNNNWRDNPVQEAAILATGIPPTNDLEAAIDATLAPGAYTAIVSGTGNTSGVALVEAYDLSQAVPGKLANISTRAFVGTLTDIVIAGFILGGNSGNDRIIARGIGPSLTSSGVPDTLANPSLQLCDANGAVVVSNNDWQDIPAQAAEVTAAGLAPTHNLEAALVATLPPGLYTALLSGVNNATGVGLVEVYDLGSP